MLLRKRVIMIEVILLLLLSSINCSAKHCKANYDTINFNTSGDVSIFACISKDKFMGTQTVAWNVKNNTNDKLEVKFTKIYSLSCGKTEKVEVGGFAPILKPGESEGDGSFADLLRDDIFVNEKCGKGGRVTSLQIDNLKIINLSAKERENSMKQEQARRDREQRKVTDSDRKRKNDQSEIDKMLKDIDDKYK